MRVVWAGVYLVLGQLGEGKGLGAAEFSVDPESVESGRCGIAAWGIG